MSSADLARPGRGRLAPTPSGLLHLGNARTFLATWLSMRAQKGEMILRVEDIDRGRSRPELEAEQLRDLEWLGLEWDVGPVRQSDRLEHYQRALAKLQSKDLAYPCVCTRKEIAATSAPHEGEERRYPNICRERFKDEGEAMAFREGRPAWRLKVESQTRSIDDLLLGEQSFNTAELVGDFQVFTKDGWPSYQLAVALDDGEMGITEVVRGRDLLASSVRQTLLAEMLELPHADRWAHLGLVREGAAKRMAKRDGSTSLKALREAGVERAAVLGLLANSLGLVEDAKSIALDELVERFAWSKVASDDLALDPAALL